MERRTGVRSGLRFLDAPTPAAETGESCWTTDGVCVSSGELRQEVKPVCVCVCVCMCAGIMTV